MPLHIFLSSYREKWGSYATLGMLLRIICLRFLLRKWSQIRQHSLYQKKKLFFDFISYVYPSTYNAIRVSALSCVCVRVHVCFCYTSSPPLQLNLPENWKFIFWEHWLCYCLNWHSRETKRNLVSSSNYKTSKTERDRNP